MDTEYDVVIAGASIAGCTAAMQYGRAGLRVALVEKHTNADASKALCGHFVLGGAEPTLRRLGLWDRMIAAGAVSGLAAVRGPGGWSVPSGADLPHSISLRRSRLDPMLRATAAATPGVDLLLGTTVVGLVEAGPRVTGLRIRERVGGERDVTGRLVVGADGHRSTVASFAGAKENVGVNERFLFWAYYRGVTLRGPAFNQVWRLDPDVAVATPTDEGLTLLGAFPVKARLPEFKADRAGALERFMSRLPDGPDLSGAERVSKVIGTVDYPPIKRDPVPRRGLALIGDAAMAGDPVPAVGCGWAFRSAEWLADATVSALRDGGQDQLDRGLRRYRRVHRFAERHDRMDRDDAKARPPNPIQRAIREAAITDPEIARRVYLFAVRAAPVSGLLNPKVIARSLRASRRPHRPMVSAWPAPRSSTLPGVR